MKLFRRKEKLYGDLVKYSHKTALENPEMVDREYGHKIAVLEKEIHEHRKLLKLYSFEVAYNVSGDYMPRKELELVQRDCDPYFRCGIYRYRGYISFEQPKIMKFVNVEPEVLLQAVEHNKNFYVQIAENDKQIKLLKKERTQFKKTYIPWKERIKDKKN